MLTVALATGTVAYRAHPRECRVAARVEAARVGAAKEAERVVVARLAGVEMVGVKVEAARAAAGTVEAKEEVVRGVV